MSTMTYGHFWQGRCYCVTKRLSTVFNLMSVLQSHLVIPVESFTRQPSLGRITILWRTVKKFIDVVQKFGEERTISLKKNRHAIPGVRVTEYSALFPTLWNEIEHNEIEVILIMSIMPIQMSVVQSRLAIPVASFSHPQYSLRRIKTLRRKVVKSKELIQKFEKGMRSQD